MKVDRKSCKTFRFSHFFDRFAGKCAILVAIASPYSDVVFANVSARKDCAPYSFDKSLEYAVLHYGAYVPYILRDERLLSICRYAAREKFGLDIGFSVYFHDQALYEFEEFPDDSYSPWSEDVEFEEIDILKGKESRTYADFGSW